MAENLPLPHPFDVRVLISRVAAQRNRPIRLVPMSGGDGGVLGLWVATRSGDIIFYEQNTTPPHQEHIILHELSHVLCNHYPAQLSTTEHMRILLPDLDPAMVQRILGRTTYLAVEEQEAELMATLIRQRAQRADGPGQATSPVADKINKAFDWHE
jgi:IrrE N-terminal-like domain